MNDDVSKLVTEQFAIFGPRIHAFNVSELSKVPDSMGFWGSKIPSCFGREG